MQMSKLDDLHTVEKLLNEFELPVSPILEYAIKERIKSEEDANVVVLITHKKNIIRVPTSKFSTISNFSLGDNRKDDFIEKIIQTTTQEQLLVFTKKGICYCLKVTDIPDFGNSGLSKNISTLIQIGKDDGPVAYINGGDFKNSELFIVSKKGRIQRSCLEEFSKVRSNGLIAMKFLEDDELRCVDIAKEEGILYCASQNGKIVKVPMQEIRVLRRGTWGIRIMDYETTGSEIVGMFLAQQDGQYLTISSNGYLKISRSDEINLSYRCYTGVQCAGLNEKAGRLLYLFDIKDNQTIVIILTSGKILRFSPMEFEVRHRTAFGKCVITSDGEEKIATVAVLSNLPNNIG